MTTDGFSLSQRRSVDGAANSILQPAMKTQRGATGIAVLFL